MLGLESKLERWVDEVVDDGFILLALAAPVPAKSSSSNSSSSGILL